MNVQEFISSGILEAYVLGEVTDAERTQVEQALAGHPELRDELRKVEETTERVAFAASISPSPVLREKVMARIAAAPKRKIGAIPASSTLRYAAAASIALALVASYFALYYRQLWRETSVALHEIVAQNRQMADNYNVVNEKLDKLQADLGIIENTAFTKVVMTGTLNDKQALASVYWNPTSNEVYISIQRLRAIAKGHQFQLWAIVDGKPVDAGVFDLGFEGLLKMKSVHGAAAFAVTVEPRGGQPAPNLNTMQVIGSVRLAPTPS